MTGEFNATSALYYIDKTTSPATSYPSLRQIRLRVCSTDNNYKCGSWSNEVKVMIDQNAPVIGNFGGSGDAPYLVQVPKLDGGYSTLAELTTAAVATKTFASDMYVSYDANYPWYLVTTAEDDSGVKEVDASGTTSAGSDTPTVHTSSSDVTFQNGKSVASARMPRKTWRARSPR